MRLIPTDCVTNQSTLAPVNHVLSDGFKTQKYFKREIGHKVKSCIENKWVSVLACFTS